MRKLISVAMMLTFLVASTGQLPKLIYKVMVSNQFLLLNISQIIAEFSPRRTPDEIYSKCDQVIVNSHSSAPECKMKQGC